MGQKDVHRGFKDRVNTLLDTEMDRAGFLKLCAVAAIAVVGAGGLIAALTRASGSEPVDAAQKPSFGYGGRSARD